MSRLLVMIKPWVIKYTKEILSELDLYGKRLQTTKVEKITLDVIAQHYDTIVHKQLPNYQHIIEDFVGLSVVIAVYEGDFKKFDTLKDNIRDKYAFEIPFNPNHGRNALHVSDSKEEFLREFEVWNAYLT